MPAIRFLRLALGLLGFLALTATEPSASSSAIRIACVGDSITYGQGAMPKAERLARAYPGQLQSLLGPGYAVGSFGHPGATAVMKSHRPFIAKPEYAAAVAFRPNIVVLLLGTNDAWHWQRCEAAFADDYRALVQRFAALDPAPRIILLVPLPALARDPSKDELGRVLRDAVQPAVRRIGAELGLTTIDLPARIPVDFTRMGDGVHPGNAIYAEMAALVAEAVRSPVPSASAAAGR